MPVLVSVLLLCTGPSDACPKHDLARQINQNKYKFSARMTEKSCSRYYILLLRLPRAGQAATTQRRWDPSPSPNPNSNLRPYPLALARTLTRTRTRTRAREARCESHRRAQASSPRAAAAGRRRHHRSVLGQASAAAQPPCRPQDAAGLARRGPLHSLRLQLRRRRLLRWRGSAPLGRL